jgi:excisionase family DNA binding protein
MSVVTARAESAELGLDILGQPCHPPRGRPAAPRDGEVPAVAQVAELLQLSEKTVYRLAQHGKLPGFKAGGSWRFRRRDIEAWAAEQIREKRAGKQ